MKCKMNIFIQKNYNYIAFNTNKFYIYFTYEKFKVIKQIIITKQRQLPFPHKFSKNIISKQYGEQNE